MVTSSYHDQIRQFSKIDYISSQSFEKCYSMVSHMPFKLLDRITMKTSSIHTKMNAYRKEL